MFIDKRSRSAISLEPFKIPNQSGRVMLLWRRSIHYHIPQVCLLCSPHSLTTWHSTITQTIRMFHLSWVSSLSGALFIYTILLLSSSSHSQGKCHWRRLCTHRRPDAFPGLQIPLPSISRIVSQRQGLVGLAWTGQTPERDYRACLCQWRSFVSRVCRRSTLNVLCMKQSQMLTSRR